MLEVSVILWSGNKNYFKIIWYFHICVLSAKYRLWLQFSIYVSAIEWEVGMEIILSACTWTSTPFIHTYSCVLEYASEDFIYMVVVWKTVLRDTDIRCNGKAMQRKCPVSIKQAPFWSYSVPQTNKTMERSKDEYSKLMDTNPSKQLLWPLDSHMWSFTKPWNLF